MNEQTVYTIDEFERESRHLDTLIWEAIAIEPKARVLICGYGSDGKIVERALEQGARVSVIEHRNDVINAFSHLGATLVRGSTSVIPAKDNAYDLAISFHYLHEVDPFFHAQVLSELSRVAKRVAIVEPAPPADPLGKRIALLYSQAKRELGLFEYYQPLEYWKKLLQSVKADISQHVFAFAKVPPREYLQDTVELLLDTIEIEEAPREYMDELRSLAHRSETQLLPPPRYVLVGAALGDLPVPKFSARVAALKARPVTPPAVKAEPAPAPVAVPEPEVREITADAGYEFPPVQAPAAATPAATPLQPTVNGSAEIFSFKQAPAATPPPAFTPGLPFGAPPPPDPATSENASPFGAPFAVPGFESPFGSGEAGAPSSWAWEPPEETEPPA